MLIHHQKLISAHHQKLTTNLTTNDKYTIFVYWKQIQTS